ncbi:beta-glucosidase BglX [Flavobacterium sp.]|uniref:beta-glucosidase BglX n=1 Tax=Flavobacterium sp. TaxID=239 RepID=UPI0026151BB6|nr:beta-glucosidase BglX [Flavobacterium sp.]
MRLKNHIVILALLSVSVIFAQKKKTVAIAPKNQFISELLSRMTLDEKLGQLNLPTSGDITTGQAGSSDIAKKIKEGKVGGLFNIKSVSRIKEVQKVAIEQSRLKIPLIFAMDVIHGYETIFPIPLGLSSSWDMPMIQQTARIAANEATADGINWTFSPMVDLSREPRWGRVSEGSGEDTYLGSQIAKAMVNGYQNNDLKAKNSLLACVKHFALYGAPEAGRDYNTVDMSRVRMYNEYFPPYKAAVDAGVGTAMASFNEVDGIPATGNKWLMTDVLRNQWKFNGFVVTDYTGIPEMIEHGMGDLQNCSSLALKAGIDMDMVGEGFLSTLKKSLEEGKISMSDIDTAVTRILAAKYDLGLFENPYKNCDIDLAKKEIFSKENRDFARKVAAESMVLLKNDKNILPLKKSGTIALFGPLFDNKANMPGTWSVAANFDKPITILEGLKSTVGKSVNILSARGCNFLSTAAEEKININPHNPKSYVRDNRTDEELIAEALEVAKKSDVLIAVLGEGAEMNGECSSRSSIELPLVQKRLLDELLKTGKPVVLVLFTGRPLVLVEEDKKLSTILNVWFPGSEAGLAISDVLFGDVNPSGKLTATWPRNVGQIPIYYNHKNTGRPLNNKEGKFQKFLSNYLDVPNEPLYPFGYGLSYTNFEYSNLKTSSSKMNFSEKVSISVDVLNSGNYDGKEIVQLYIRDVVGSITRPMKELKGFKKIFLKKGEKQTVTFEISVEDLKFYNSDLQFVAEEGQFEIFIGKDSDATNKINLELVK